MEEEEVATGDGEGTTGDLPGYVPTGEDWHIQEVYGDWVNYSNGAHLSEGTQDNKEWQTHSKTMAFMLARRYNSPSRRVGCRFVHALAVELTGVCQRRWKTEGFIVFQKVILQSANHVTKSCKIRRRNDQRLDVWEAGEHKMMLEDTARTCVQYLYTRRGYDSLEHRTKIYHSLVLWEKLRSSVR